MITEIRGRGNSTWNAPKNLTVLSLDEKTKLLNNNAKIKVGYCWLITWINH
jgi:hypothetical protein